MSDVSELSKSALARRYESMRATVRRVRDETKHAARLGTAAVLTAAGGFASGYMSTQASLAKIPGTELPTDAVLGSGLMLGCALDMFDAANDNVAAFAGGLLAAAAAREGLKFGLQRAGAAAR